MAFARTVFNASGGETDVAIGFSYLEEAHVTVKVNGTLQTQDTPTTTNDYDIVNSGADVRFTVALTASDVVVIQRTTSQSTRIVDYTQPSTLSEDDLDTHYLQNFYMAQESIDIAELALGVDATENWDGESKRLKNLATGTASTDAINKAQLDAAVILSGNVPTPDNPGEDDYMLVASAGSFDWTAPAAVRTALGLVIGTDVQADLAVPVQSEAEAGTATTERVWTAQRVAQAIAQLAMPRSYLAGLELANDTDADHDIAISPGECRDDTNAAALYLTATLTKQIDAVWALGDDAGGLDTGTVAIDTWYHVFLIRRSDTGVVDALFSTSPTSPTMPTNYDQQRRIGSVFTDGSANIIPFLQDGDHYQWTTVQDDVSSVNNPGSSAALRTLSVPSGVRVLADFILWINNADVSTATDVWVSDPSQTDEAPTTTRRFNSQSGTFAGGVNRWAGHFQVRTNTSSQIRTRFGGSTDTDLTLNIYTRGWIDTRGRDA